MKPASKSPTAPKRAVRKPVPAPQVSHPLAIPAGRLKWLAYGLACIAPFGLLLGILYASQTCPSCRRFGQTCMLLAAAGFLAAVAAGGLMVLLPMVSGGNTGPGVYY